MNLLKQSYNFIHDHVIKGKIVYPFVCVANSLYEFLDRNNIKSNFIIQNLKLGRGVILNDIDELTKYYWKKNDNLVELIGPAGEICYKAEIVLTDLPQVQIKSPEIAASVCPYYPFVFHGPMLQTLRNYELLNYGLEAHAEIKTSFAMHYERTDWFLDPAVFDGALQLLCFMTGHKKRAMSLPVLMEKIIVYRKLPPQDSVKCIAKITKYSSLKYQADLYFFDAQGLFASILNVNMCFLLKRL